MRKPFFKIYMRFFSIFVTYELYIVVYAQKK